jgi:hypothetical protein
MDWLSLILFVLILACVAVRHRFVRPSALRPCLLYVHGRFLKRALQRHGVREQEVRAAVRAAGLDLDAPRTIVVLERNGALRVLGGVPSERRRPSVKVWRVMAEPAHDRDG